MRGIPAKSWDSNGGDAAGVLFPAEKTTMEFMPLPVVTCPTASTIMRGPGSLSLVILDGRSLAERGALALLQLLLMTRAPAELAYLMAAEMSLLIVNPLPGLMLMGRMLALGA